jgi:hypothetical protein
VQEICFLLGHFFFAHKYWEISHDLRFIFTQTQTSKGVYDANRVIYYIVIVASCIIPIVFAALLGLSKISLLNLQTPSTQFQAGINWTA